MKLRSLLAGVFFVLYGLIAIVATPFLALPIWPASGFRALIRFFYRVFIWCAGAVRLFSVEVDETTRRRLAAAHGEIIVANHVSLLDVMILIALLPDAAAIAKAAVSHNPFLAVAAKNMLIVNDGDATAVVDKSADFLSAGVNVIVFPQGTRGGTKLHRGAAHIALASRRTILPLHFNYSPSILGKNQPWWDVGNSCVRISISAGCSINPVGEDTHSAAKSLTASIARAINVISSPGSR